MKDSQIFLNEDRKMTRTHQSHSPAAFITDNCRVKSVSCNCAVSGVKGETETSRNDLPSLKNETISDLLTLLLNSLNILLNEINELNFLLKRGRDET